MPYVTKRYELENAMDDGLDERDLIDEEAENDDEMTPEERHYSNLEDEREDDDE